MADPDAIAKVRACAKGGTKSVAPFPIAQSRALVPTRTPCAPGPISHAASVGARGCSLRGRRGRRALKGEKTTQAMQNRACPGPSFLFTLPPHTQAFVDHYYSTFDTNRQALGGLYQVCGGRKGKEEWNDGQAHRFFFPFQSPTFPSPQADSILTFEGVKVQGQAAILTKLTSLPFQVCERVRGGEKTEPSPQNLFSNSPPNPQACKHHVSSIDAQPSTSGGILVFVTGQLLPEGETNPLKFSQAFHLAAAGGSYAVSNDVFRLNYA